MTQLKKYVCLLPTDGHQKGDIVEMTDIEFNAQNAGEKHPRFAEISQESVVETTATTEEAEEQSGDQVVETETTTEPETTEEATETEVKEQTEEEVATEEATEEV